MKNSNHMKNHYRPMRGTPTEVLFDFDETALLEEHTDPSAVLLAMEIIESLGRRDDPRRRAPYMYNAFDLGVIFEMGRIQGIREEREKKTNALHREFKKWPAPFNGRPDLIYELGKVEGIEAAQKKAPA